MGEPNANESSDVADVLPAFADTELKKSSLRLRTPHIITDVETLGLKTGTSKCILLPRWNDADASQALGWRTVGYFYSQRPPHTVEIAAESIQSTKTQAMEIATHFQKSGHVFKKTCKAVTAKPWLQMQEGPVAPCTGIVKTYKADNALISVSCCPVSGP